IDPSYGSILRKYERSLKQRNNLLKRDYVDNGDFFAWDVAISEYGSKIINERREATEMINQYLSDYYKDISGTKDEIVIKYSDSDIKTSHQIMQRLEASFGRDKALGYTSTGPHRHDVVFEFNGSPALNTASRGEVRSIVLALKKIE